MGSTQITLPESVDGSTAGPLRSAFLSHRGKPVLVDGQKVERLGAAGLQILIAAAATWASDDHSFTITNPSSALVEGLGLSGATLPGISNTYGA